MKWAENECEKSEMKPNGKNKREILGDLFYLLRFPTMSTKGFKECVQDDGLLTPEEVGNIFIYITSKKNIKFNFSIENRGFNSLPQKICFFDLNIYQDGEEISHFQQSTLRFSVNSSIYLNGIEAYCTEQSDRHSFIIKDKENKKILNLKNQKTYPIMLHTPILIISNEIYTIQFKWECDDHYGLIYQMQPEYHAENVQFKIIESENGRVEKIFFKEID